MPDTAYTPRILKLSAQLADIQDEPAGPMFSPEEIAARKAKQFKDEQLSILGKLSGDKELETVGAALLPHALKAAEPRYTEHGEFDPLSGELRTFPEYERRRKEERTARELQGLQMKDEIARQTQPYKDAKQAMDEEKLRLAQERLDLAKARAANSLQGKPLTGQVYKDVKRLGDDAQNLSMIRNNFDANFTETSKGISPLGALQDRAAALAPGFAPDAWVRNRDAWADLQRLKEMKSRYDLFGATLTGHEKASWESVTPPRGSTKDELNQWFTKQHELLQRAINRGASAAAAGGYNQQQIEEMTGGSWKAPRKSGGLSPEQQKEMDDLEKELGGGR